LQPSTSWNFVRWLTDAPPLFLGETDCSVVEDNLTLCEEFLFIRDNCCVYREKSNLEKKDNLDNFDSSINIVKNTGCSIDV